MLNTAVIIQWSKLEQDDWKVQIHEEAGSWTSRVRGEQEIRALEIRRYEVWLAGSTLEGKKMLYEFILLLEVARSDVLWVKDAQFKLFTSTLNVIALETWHLHSVPPGEDTYV